MTRDRSDDLRFMRRVLALARRGRGRTSPNPMVGSVIVCEGAIVGEGYHHAVGRPHAEIEALRDAGEQSRGATVYVNLEPCCHTGRTGPCSRALVAAGVARVVVGMRDPNPLVSGGGIAELEAAGVDVEVGVLEDECRALNEGFVRLVTARRPFVTLKLAATLDGRLASSTGDSKWITGPASRARVHRMRAEVDGVAVGAGTALADNPQLTARTRSGGLRRRQPARVVFDGELALAQRHPSALLEGPGGRVLVVAADGGHLAPQAVDLEARGATVLRVPAGGQPGTVDMVEALLALGREGLASLLVEGGSGVGTALLRAGLVDRLAVFLAPKLLGGGGSVPMFGDLGFRTMAEALALEDAKLERFGPDLLWTATPVQGGDEPCSQG